MSSTPDYKNLDYHIPVMGREVVEALASKDGEIMVDGTFGAGGYSRAILDSSDCITCAIDQDPDAITRGQPLVELYAGRLKLLQGNFADMDDLVRDAGFDGVDGVTLDLGVSSPQLDVAERGFSFRNDGPLDMRMSLAGKSAADVVNEYDEKAIADILYLYGEEKKSRYIAKAIVRARENGPITRTLQLADLIAGVVRQEGRIHPATRSFQGLRIYVNDELGALQRGLQAAERLLRPGGRLAIVSFHSLEDRIVKRFMKERAEQPRGSRHMPDLPEGPAPSFTLPSKKAIAASAEEAAENPRARSAKLRVAIRTEAAPLVVPEKPKGGRGGRGQGRRGRR